MADDRQKARTRISKRVMVDVTALAILRNRKMAIRVVSTKRESDKSLNVAPLFKVKISFVKNNKFEKKTSIVSQIV